MGLEAIQQPQQPELVQVPPKAQTQALAGKVYNIFRLLSQENINESFLAQIHEPQLGWKKQFLESYRENDLLGCANLLEHAVQECVEEAKQLLTRKEDPAYDAFLQAIAKIGQEEKTALVSCFSKEEQPLSPGMKTFEAARTLPMVGSAQQAISALWTARNLPLLSGIAGRTLGAALNIAPVAHLPHVMGLINEAYNGDKWPLIVGGVAGLTTVCICIGTGVVYAAPRAGMMAMTTASEITRGVQKAHKHWTLKKIRGNIDERLQQVTVGKKRKLEVKEIEGERAAKARKISSTLDPIFAHLAQSEGIDTFKKKFTSELFPHPAVGILEERPIQEGVVAHLPAPEQPLPAPKPQGEAPRAAPMQEVIQPQPSVISEPAQQPSIPMEVEEEGRGMKRPHEEGPEEGVERPSKRGKAATGPSEDKSVAQKPSEKRKRKRKS